MPDGTMCAKCTEVSERLVKDDLLNLINYIAIADSQNADSEGMQLAHQHKVERAPFFLVEEEGGEVHIFDVYFKFKRFLQKQKKPERSLAKTA